MKIIRSASIPSGTSLTALYREVAGDWPKFFKMDVLSRLGFLLSELLLKDEPGRFTPREDRAVIVFSRSGCICDDRGFLASTEEFASPSLFVYTLPNIVTGEIAIRNKFEGETSAWLLETPDPERIVSLTSLAFNDPSTREAICCWVEASDEENFSAWGFLVGKDGEGFDGLHINSYLSTLNEK